MDLTEYVGMLSDSVVNELDYSLEARNQQRLADLYRNHRYVLIPDTVPELCRPRVLVSEFVDRHLLRQRTAAPAEGISQAGDEPRLLLRRLGRGIGLPRRALDLRTRSMMGCRRRNNTTDRAYDPR